MFQQIVKGVKWTATFFFTLVITLFLALLTWAAWYYYQDQKQQRQFEEEGKVTRVTITHVEWGQEKTWLDKWGNSVYVTFSYGARPYTTRWVFDSTWVGTGDKISMLYHPGLDTFRQPERKQATANTHRRSRLLASTIFPFYHKEDMPLVTVFAFSALLAFLTCSLLLQLTGWSVWSTIGRGLVICVLLAAAILFSFDAWEYHGYYQHLKSRGQETKVTVLKTDRVSHAHRGRRGRIGRSSYTYEATVKYGNQERVIAIEEADYERLKPKDRITVLYDSVYDDMLLPTYNFGFSRFLVPLFWWVLVLVFSGIIRVKSKAKNRKPALQTVKNT